LPLSESGRAVAGSRNCSKITPACHRARVGFPACVTCASPPPVRRQSEDVVGMAAACGDDSPWARGWTTEGLIEVLEPLVVEPRRTRIWEVVNGRTDNVTVAMDAPHDPHNGAAVMRTCDAFGIQTVHVVEALEPFLFVRKVSLGTERWIDVERHPGYEPAIRRLKSQGYTLVSAVADGTLVPKDLGKIERLALVMGNERDGVSEAFMGAADHTVRIPMRGFVESLNMSVSTAILLHAAMGLRPGDLSEQRRREVYARGLIRSVVRVRDVLRHSPPR